MRLAIAKMAGHTVAQAFAALRQHAHQQHAVKALMKQVLGRSTGDCLQAWRQRTQLAVKGRLMAKHVAAGQFRSCFGRWR